MTKFNWMAILRTGNFTDKNGKNVTIDESKLDKIIAATDVNKEPQFVIDHPGFDEVGFGTISKLKRVGQYLFCLPKTVNDKFKKAVNDGKLPSRSVTLDENTLELKNISFLNKTLNPAVSGLGSYSFSSSQTNGLCYELSLPGVESHFADLESSNFEFANYEVSNYPFRIIQTVIRNIKNFLIEKFSLDDAENIIPEYFMTEIGTPPNIYEIEDTSINKLTNEFSQNKKDSNMKIDLSKLTPEQRQAFEALENQVNTLTTKLDAKNIELQSATTQLTTIETTALKNEILQFCAGDDVKLKIKPAEKDKVVAFLLAQKAAGTKGTIEFSAADNTKVQFNSFEFAKELIKCLPDLIELSELANNKTGKSATEEDVQFNEGVEAAKRLNNSL